MKAVIFCPGPSLAKSSAGARGDLTIAVNRAIGFRSADVWAAGDIPMLTDQRPDVIGKPELFTAAVTNAYLRDHGRGWSGKVTEFEQLFSYLEPASCSWTLFTFTAAIVYAAHAGAKQIEIYGCDWTGTNDFDGWSQAGNRSPERWKLEREVYSRLIPLIHPRGTEVRRIVI